MNMPTNSSVIDFTDTALFLYLRFYSNPNTSSALQNTAALDDTATNIALIMLKTHHNKGKFAVIYGGTNVTLTILLYMFTISSSAPIDIHPSPKYFFKQLRFM